MMKFALSAVLLWGLSGPLGLLSQGNENLPSTVSALFLGGLVYWLLFERQRVISDFSEILSVGWKTLSLCLAFSGIFIVYYYCWFFSIFNYQPIGALVINYMWPLVLYLSHNLLFQSQRNNPIVDIPILLLSFLGAAIIVFNPTEGDIAASLSGGNYGVAFLAAVLPALYFGIARYADDRVNLSTTALFTFGAFVGFVFSGILAFINSNEIDPVRLVPPFTMGVMSIGLASLLYSKALSFGRDALISSLSFISPAIAVMIMSLILGEALEGYILFGVSLILVGNVLTTELLYRHVISSFVFIGTFYLLAWAYLVKFIAFPADMFDSIGFAPAVFALLAGLMLGRLSQAHVARTEAIYAIFSLFDLSNQGVKGVKKTALTDKEKRFSQLLRYATSGNKNRFQWFRNSSSDKRIDWGASQTDTSLIEQRYIESFARLMAHRRPIYSIIEVFALTLCSFLAACNAIAGAESLSGKIGGVVIGVAIFSVLGRVIDMNFRSAQSVQRQVFELQSNATDLVFLPHWSFVGDISSSAEIVYEGRVLDAGEVQNLRDACDDENKAWRIVALALATAVSMQIWLVVS